MAHRVRLISKDGHVAYQSETKTFHPTAIIHSNRVFVFNVVIGDWAHYREVTAERIHSLETERAQPVYLPPLTGDFDNA